MCTLYFIYWCANCRCCLCVVGTKKEKLWQGCHRDSSPILGQRTYFPSIHPSHPSCVSVCWPTHPCVRPSQLNWLALSIYHKLYDKYNYTCLSLHRRTLQWNEDMHTHTPTHTLYIHTAFTVTLLICQINPRFTNLMRSVKLSPVVCCVLTQSRSWSVSSLAQV